MTAVEYKVVELLGGGTKHAPAQWTELLNAMAADGWRLVSVDQAKAFFERPRPS